MKGSRESQTNYRPPGPRGPGFGGPRGGFPGFGMPPQKPKDFKGTVKRLTGYLKPYSGQLLAVLVMGVLGTAFSIIAPKLLGDITTKLFEVVTARIAGVPAEVDYRGIGNIILILLALYAVSSVFTWIQQYWMAGIAQKTVYTLRREVNEKLSRLPLRYFDARPHGETLSRITNDVDNIGNTLQQSLMQLVTSFVTIVGVIAMMLYISPLLTLVCLVTLPLSAWAAAGVAKRSQVQFAGQQRSLGELSGHVEEMIAGHRIVKAFGREEDAMRKFDGINGRLYDSGWRAQFISGILMPLTGFIGNLGYVIICVVGGILVAGSRIAIGDVQAFIQYARQFNMPITQLAGIANIIQSTVASAERVFELLDEAEETPDAAADQPAAQDGPRGAVAFRNVRFGYAPDELLFDDLSFEVKPGRTVAIVGPTGAGKTTLVNLLMRFYDIQGGSISIDGRDIRTMERGRLRSLFGMVLQDTWLFGGTIRDNIAFGREDATEEEIIAAARAAYADRFIRTLPDGYDTVLNEEAANLSQGQKQLLTIARAVLADPAILILDEATSNVDTRTEYQIQDAMNRLMRGRTSFVIAHRLSTIRGADVILVMNRGRVIEQGTHEELLAKGGFYAELYYSQFARPEGKPAV
ncbi:ABC-type multidrug transport system, ATPase and permease component [Thermobacillus composti KWC4]|uniref:ABC-type multidrug transport system, ATPase and permease component n=1 Tax=Thermobacillus composti (strain DSM 18247 / JCM 13945 / KWC4) TaxID=717605 RepID=L0ECY2_THECK|nr:ABC transporter ATP-binding protein [Thermobacillus composti]AGA58133.1 ABC-type multidrug transport system, ATPase and permease component [Thermobacillus composti KWC4]